MQARWDEQLGWYWLFSWLRMTDEIMIGTRCLSCTKRHVYLEMMVLQLPLPLKAKHAPVGHWANASESYHFNHAGRKVTDPIRAVRFLPHRRGRQATRAWPERGSNEREHPWSISRKCKGRRSSVDPLNLHSGNCSRSVVLVSSDKRTVEQVTAHC
jgi:hypothetical protein